MLDKSVLESTRHLPRLSLQDMSMIKIITTLCNNRQLLRLILNCRYLTDEVPLRMRFRDTDEWRAVLAMASEMISPICSSVLLKKKMLEYLWVICDRIMHWKYVYAPCISKEFLQFFYWTDRGRIDTTRTARHIIRNKNINVFRRFKLACRACLVGELSGPWSEMSLDYRKSYCKRPVRGINSLCHFWALTLEGRYIEYEETVFQAIHYAVENGLLEVVKNVLAISRKHNYEHSPYVFLDSLSIEFESKSHLDEGEIEMVYFLFFQMDDSEQENFFNEHSALVLSLLLHASEYELCLTLLEERLQSYSENDFHQHLKVILYTYLFEVANEEACRELFKAVWRMIPTSIRNSESMPDFRVSFPTTLIYTDFLFVYKRESLKKVNDLTSADLNCKCSIYPFDFHVGKWDLLCFFIEEITTVDWLIKYKNYIGFPYKTSPSQHECMRLKLIRFFRYVQRKIIPAKTK